MQNPEISESPLVMAGEVIAERMKLATLTGKEAVIFFLVHKHHWTLDFVRGLPDKDLEFLVDHVRANFDA